MDLDKKINSFIKTYGKRIKINFLLDKILFGILLCGVLSFILLSVSVFVPFKDCYRVIAIVDRRFFQKPTYMQWNEVTIDEENQEETVIVINKIRK